MRKGELENGVKDRLEEETFVVQREEFESVAVKGKRQRRRWVLLNSSAGNLNLC
jgi:hypothetical protein